MVELKLNEEVKSVESFIRILDVPAMPAKGSDGLCGMIETIISPAKLGSVGGLSAGIYFATSRTLIIGSVLATRGITFLKVNLIPPLDKVE